MFLPLRASFAAALGASVIAAGLAVPAAGAPDAPTAYGQSHAHSDEDVVVDPDAVPLRRATPQTRTPRSGQGEANVPGHPVGVSTYDVHVIAVDTPAAPHGTSREHSTAVVRRLDEEYNRETNGLYRFRMGTFQTATVTSGELCGVFSWGDRFEDRIAKMSARPGATDFTWVVVAPEECGFTGQAILWGRGVHMAGAWDAEGPTTEPVDGEYSSRNLDVSVLAHEIAHNLGLDHARVQAEHSGTALEKTAYFEYGDPLSTMGTNNWTMRFSAAELLQLGATRADRVRVLDAASQTVTLAPLSSPTGVNTVVVHRDGRQHVVLSYRDGTGQDWPARWTWFSEREEPHVGVFVESGSSVLDGYAGSPRNNAGILARPAGTGTDDGRVAFRAGESVTLPGGVTVKVQSITAAGATVQVTQPVDTRGPVIAPLYCYHPKAGEPCVEDVEDDLHYGPDHVSDDTYATRIGLAVDGKDRFTVARTGKYPGDLDAQGSTDEWEFRLPLGKRTVTIWAEDLWGNRSTTSQPVTVESWRNPPRDEPTTTPAPTTQKAKKPSAPRSVKVTKRTRKSVRLTWKAPKSAGSGVTSYVVKVGTKKAKKYVYRTVKVKKSKRTVTVKGLKPGKTYRVKVAARSKAGTSKAKVVSVKTKR